MSMDAVQVPEDAQQVNPNESSMLCWNGRLFKPLTYNPLVGSKDVRLIRIRSKGFLRRNLVCDVIHASLDPDYTLSVEQLYTTIARYLLLRDGCAIILHTAGLRGERVLASLPSWVPDWSQLRKWHGWVLDLLEGYFAGGMAPTPVTITDGSTPETMKLRGITVDRKTSVNRPRLLPSQANRETTYIDHIRSILTWLDELKPLMPSSSPAGQSSHDVFCRALTGTLNIDADAQGLFDTFPLEGCAAFTAVQNTLWLTKAPGAPSGKKSICSRGYTGAVFGCALERGLMLLSILTMTISVLRPALLIPAIWVASFWGPTRRSSFESAAQTPVAMCWSGNAISTVRWRQRGCKKDRFGTLN